MARDLFLDLLEQGSHPTNAAFTSTFHVLEAERQWQATATIYGKIAAIADDNLTKQLHPFIQQIANAYSSLGESLKGAKVVNDFVAEHVADMKVRFAIRADAIEAAVEVSQERKKYTPTP